MFFQHNKINGAIMVYGFIKKKGHYDMVVTLYLHKEVAKIYGFLSKKRMLYEDFMNLWEYIRDIVKIRFIEFEALEDHAKIYETYMPIISKKDSETFNGYPSKILKVDLKKGLGEKINEKEGYFTNC